MSLSPELLLHGYSIGIFPMAEHREDPEIFWVDPKRRGIFPLNNFHISRSLARRMRTCGYRIEIDTDFAGVVDGCADRAETWINEEIRAHYLALYESGHAHSIECWLPSEDPGAPPELVGGLYGVSFDRVFCGESMFSRDRDTSKIALCHLVARLTYAGFQLLDTQFVTKHLQRFGALEIPRSEYRTLLSDALKEQAEFYRGYEEGEMRRYVET